jgi:hypothetical protein
MHADLLVRTAALVFDEPLVNYLADALRKMTIPVSVRIRTRMEEFIVVEHN